MTAKLRVPVVGTVGVPARYGGFETLAEQLCEHIPADEMTFVVYCQASAYGAGERAPNYRGHERVFLPVFRANGVGSLFYDALALLHAVLVVRARHVLVLGYSGAWLLPALRMLRPNIRFVVNVDGMEWRREKFSGPAKLLLKGLEFFAARWATAVIADNAALASLFRDRYRRAPVTIAYGGDHTLLTRDSLDDVALRRHYLAIARIEPENNAHLILQACSDAGVPLVFIGNWDASTYGQGLRKRFANVPGFQLLDPIYDQSELGRWRMSAVGYLHGHSVGGTNPSLVEALFHTDLLISFDCAFNRASLSNAGHYFTDAKSLATLLRTALDPINRRMLSQLRQQYRWHQIAAEYRKVVTEQNGLAGSVPRNDDRQSPE